MDHRFLALFAIFASSVMAGTAHAQLSTDRFKQLEGRTLSETLGNIDTSKFVKVALPSEVRGKGCSFYSESQLRQTRWNVPVEWLAGKYRISGRGEVEVYSQYIAQTGEWWDNNISSLKCDANCSVTAYDEAEKRGRKISFNSSDGVVDTGRHRGWDNAISSFVVSCTRLVR